MNRGVELSVLVKRIQLRCGEFLTRTKANLITNFGAVRMNFALFSGFPFGKKCVQLLRHSVANQEHAMVTSTPESDAPTRAGG